MGRFKEKKNALLRKGKGKPGRKNVRAIIGSDKNIGNVVMFNEKSRRKGGHAGEQREGLTSESGKPDIRKEEVARSASGTESFTTLETISDMKIVDSVPMTEEDVFEGGDMYFKEGQYAKAKKKYRDALRNTSDGYLKSQLYLAMGNAALQEKNDEFLSEEERLDLRVEIVDYYSIAIAILPENVPIYEVLNIYAKLGNILYSFGDLDGALRQYNQVLEHSSEISNIVLAQMLCNYAMIKCENDEYDEAQIYFERFLRCGIHYDDIELHITNFNVAYHLGSTSFQLEENVFTIKLFSAFLQEYHKKNPEPGQYDVGEVHFMLAEIYEKAGENENLDLALEHYTSFLDYKDPMLNERLQSNKYIEGKVEDEMVTVFARIGNLSFRAQYFSLAGNSLREAFYSLKLFAVKDDLMLFRLLEKAYISYTKANDKGNRISMLEELITLLEGMKDSDHPISYAQIADYYEALGNLYKKSYRNSSACECFTKCLEVRKRYLTSTHPELEKLQCRVSTYLYNEGRYNEALNVCEHVAYGSDNDGIRRKTLCIVGKIHAKQLNESRCITAFNRAVELAEVTGTNSLDLADTYELYGQANFQLERFDESIDCFHSAFKIRASYEDTTAEECLNLVRGMVDGYRTIRKYKLALIACSKILATQQDIQVPDVEVASTMEMMADLHCLVGEKYSYANALELYHISSEILREEYGPSHETLLLIYVKMARILGLKLNDREKSLQLFHTVHKSYKYAKKGLKPMSALRGLEGEGDVLFHVGEYLSAQQKYTSVLNCLDEVKSRVNGNQVQKIIFQSKVELFYKLGCLHSKIKEHDNALDYFGRGLDMIMRLNISAEDVKNVRTSKFFYEIGLIHKELNKRDIAIEKLSEAGEILEKIPKLDRAGLSLLELVEEELRNIRSTRCMVICQ